MNVNTFYAEHSITSFEEAQDFLGQEPYYLDLKQDRDLYRISHIADKSDMTNEVVKSLSGLILNVENISQIHYKGQKLSEQVLLKEGEELQLSDITTIDINHWNSIKVKKLYDGSRIKLFYHTNQWIVSTSRCIDATKAYWNSNKSFYELFIDCIGDYDLNQLDINKCYTFIILHPENRIVLNYLEPSCIHILTYDKTECKEVDDDINLPKPEECNFASFEDFINAVTDLDYTEPGYMLVDENNNRVRVMSRKYEEVRNLKGNIPNMAKRFLQLRKIEPEKIPIFLQYYPEYTELYNNLERHIIYICNVIFQKYKVRRRQHRRVELSQIESDIHYRVHGLYLGLRQASNLTNTNIIRSITLDDITIIVNSLPINKIYQLLQEYTIVLDESV
jgi:hypothetical protein